MLGPKGVTFDNDDYLDDNDDEDLKNDPVSQLDMQVRCVGSVAGSDVNALSWRTGSPPEFHSRVRVSTP